MGNLKQEGEDEHSKMYESLNPAKKALNPLLNGGGTIRLRQDKKQNEPQKLSSIPVRRADSAKGIRVRNNPVKSNILSSIQNN